MKITYSITKEDFWNYNKYVYYSPFKTKLNLVLTIIFVPAFMYTSSFFITHSKMISLLSTLPIFWFIYYNRYSHFRKKILKFAENEKGVLDEQTVEIGPEGVSRVTHSDDGLSKWTAVSKIEMTNDYVFIFFNKITAIIIPKRIFKTEDEAIQFYNTANNFFETYSN